MGKRHRILIIDDDQFFRVAFSSILAKEYLVMIASSGEEGFLRAQQTEPDLVIIDMQMPGWSGMETLIEFKHDERLKEIPVMFLTADSTKSTVMAAIENGVTDFLPKMSATPDVLNQKIQKLLGIAAAGAKVKENPDALPIGQSQPADTPEGPQDANPAADSSQVDGAQQATNPAPEDVPDKEAMDQESEGKVAEPVA